MKRTERTPDDARHWLAEAEMRLEHARGYVPGGNARIFTEQAHYAAEFSLKAVIVSRGGIFAPTHNIQELLDTTRRLGETIPPAVVPAQELTACPRRRPTRGRRGPRGRATCPALGSS